LRKISNPKKRAKHVHDEVQKHMDELFASPAVEKLVTCKKGCAGCCHTQVSITKDEAELYAQKIVDGHDIDFTRLYLQGETWNDSEEWYTLPHSLRKCIFLGDDQLCSIYEDRPTVCRTNSVLSDPEDCFTLDGTVKPIRILNTYKADMAIMGAFLQSKENGALPHMVWKALSRIKGRVSSKTTQKAETQSQSISFD
jgi:uncharacterized protein